MQGALQSLKQELGGLRTGRASREPARSGAGRGLWHAHAAQPGRDRQRAGAAADLRPGLGPIDGACGREGDPRLPISASARRPKARCIRLRIPELNEERRKELVKVAHKYAEAARVAVRHVRRDGLDMLKKLEKDHKISEDDHKRQAERGAEGDRRDHRRDRPDCWRPRKRKSCTV